MSAYQTFTELFCKIELLISYNYYFDYTNFNEAYWTFFRYNTYRNAYLFMATYRSSNFHAEANYFHAIDPLDVVIKLSDRPYLHGTAHLDVNKG